MMPILEAKNIVKRFGKHEVLKGVSLAIHQKEIVVIMGPSGGGKTTLLRTLNLLEEPSDGEIYFRGKKIDPRSRDANELRKKVSMVFQLFTCLIILTCFKCNHWTHKSFRQITPRSRSPSHGNLASGWLG